MRGSWRPNITEIFWPRSHGRQRFVFLVLHGCSTEALESALLGAGLPYYISSSPSPTFSTQLNCLNSTVQFVGLILPSNSHAVIWTRLHASAISSDISRSGCVATFGMACVIVIEGNNCHAVQRSLSSGVSVYESIMGFFFTSSHFISQFPPTRFPLTTTIGMCHFLPVHHLEWHFWPGQKVKT